ncbi:hypothetical protein [Xanthobacter pseudotagetidis]|uniref:hypothetical protein n=1 Tax=Xanthobacter pseudotagetidis TaxID=3119911 RepID=UPI00372B7209
MSDTVKFEGTVVRIEQGGFGIVMFDRPVGPHANTHGVFSGVEARIPYDVLAKGVHVVGEAEADDRDFAAITALKVAGGY